MKVLVLGGTGQVGWELRRALAPFGAVAAPGRPDADLSRPDSLASVVEASSPDVIVNAAAYTAVDKAETEAELARTINTDSVGMLAALAKKRDALFVHFSTDYVFDGASPAPYREGDETNPLSVYGQTKRDGEIAIEQVGGKYLIFRTSWVHAARGSNFIKTMLRLAAERDTLRIVSDQCGAPTSAELIADVTAHAVRHFMTSDSIPGGGLYHLTAGGETNWCDYARYILDQAAQRGLSLRCTSEQVTPILTADYVTAARRPLNSRLDTSKLAKQFGVTLPNWRQDVLGSLTKIIAVNQAAQGLSTDGA